MQMVAMNTQLRVGRSSAGIRRGGCGAGSSRRASFGQIRTASRARLAGGRARGHPDDREAPVVQADQLGEDFGAQSAAVAGDGVDPELAWHHRCRRAGTGSTGAFAVPQHHPCACCRVRLRRASSALRISRTAPSGWLQAPRPSTWPSQRRSVPGWRCGLRRAAELRRRPRPGQTGTAALARGFVGEVAGHPGGLGEPAGVGRAGPRSGPRPRRHPAVPGRRRRRARLRPRPRRPSSEVAAEQQRLQRRRTRRRPG